jgi:YidC/Oxa1 family membrane protein insertase
MVLANIFQPLIDIFGPVLVFFHSIIGGSWGWSIIALTVVVRALLLPLAFKQMHSMQKLQQVAPQMKAIQAKYKDDKQRQQQETKVPQGERHQPVRLVSPARRADPGVQFIGLFYTLRTRLREDICPGLQAAYRHAYALHHNIPLKEAAGQTTACHGLNGSSWLFIHDLTNTATGLTLVVLIVLYVGTQLASSLMMQAPTMDQTQRRMMLLLPLFFVIFIVSFPAGLVLYWITTNTWTMRQQWAIRRRLGPVVPVTPAASTASSGSGDGRRAPLTTNGARSGGALSELPRGRAKPEEKQPAAVGASRTLAAYGPASASPAQEEEAFRAPALAMGIGMMSASECVRELLERIKRHTAASEP